MNLLAGLSRKSWREGFWSLGGTVASIFAGLALVKIAAVWVPSEQYGEASLVLGAILLLNNLLVGPLMTAHMRVYYDYRQLGFGQWFTKIFFRICLIVALSCAGFYTLIAIGWWAIGSPYLIKMVFPAVLIIILQPFMSSMINYLEASRLYGGLAIVNTSQKLLQVPSLLLLLTAPISAASAVLMAQVMPILPLIIFSRWLLSKGEAALVAIEPPPRETAVRDVVRQFTAFGVALPLGYLINWVLSTSDRFLLAHFMTTQDVGVYTMNYGFWSMPYLMLGAWLETWTRPRIYEKASQQDWQGMRNVLARRMGLALGLGVTGSVMLVFVGPYLSTAILGPNYQIGWSVPIGIAIAHLFLIIGYSASPVFLATKKMNVVLSATAVAAALNICINIFAIPKFGLVGAAIGTMAAYMVWATIIVISANRYMNILCTTSPKKF